MEQTHQIQRIADDLTALGIPRDGSLLVHSSLSALGLVDGGPETVVKGLLKALGPEGTLLMPALSYETVTRRNPVFDVRKTPSNIGVIPEYFRKRKGTRRSIHPTHSVCAYGAKTEAFLGTHLKDSTPVGPHSPFRVLRDLKGYILMLGCGLKPNTSMHGIEELVEPPYLFSKPINYMLTLYDGTRESKTYTPHNFNGWEQRYDRVSSYLTAPDLRVGYVLNAHAFLINAEQLWQTVQDVMQKNPLAFVAKVDNW